MFCPCTGSCPMYCTGYDDGLDHPVYISSRQQFKSVRGQRARAAGPGTVSSREVSEIRPRWPV
jgi:hypothetical protein